MKYVVTDTGNLDSSLFKSRKINFLLNDSHKSITSCLRDWHLRWIDYQNLDEETERRYVRKCIRALQDASPNKKAPVGWYTGRIGPNSRRIVIEEYKKLNLPLLYDCDAYNDDIPYWIKVGDTPHLVIPYTLDQVNNEQESKKIIKIKLLDSNPDAVIFKQKTFFYSTYIYNFFHNILIS